MIRSFTAAELDARIPHVVTDGHRRLICYSLEQACALRAKFNHPEKWVIEVTTWDAEGLGVITNVPEDDSPSESFVIRKPGAGRLLFDLVDGPFPSKDEAFNALALSMETAP